MNSAGKPKMFRPDEMTTVMFVSTDPTELPHELDYINQPQEEWRKQISKIVFFGAHLNISYFSFILISLCWDKLKKLV